MQRCCYISFVLLFAVANLNAKGNVKRVSAVHFKGLGLLNKYEIINNVRKRTDGNNILIDIDSLHEQLKLNGLIESYTVEIEQDVLIISINEKKVSYVVALIKDETTQLFELDNNFFVISKNTIHAHTQPICYFTDRYFDNMVLNDEACQFLRFIDTVKKNRGSLYDTISDIYYDDTNIKLYLHDRKTTFILRATMENFDYLQYIVGYLDRIKYYPDKVEVLNNRVVIR